MNEQTNETPDSPREKKATKHVSWLNKLVIFGALWFITALSLLQIIQVYLDNYVNNLIMKLQGW